MRAPQVRKILANIPIGEEQRVDLGPGDTPRSLRNYFLVIAKLEGYTITTKQYSDYVKVQVHSLNVSESKAKKKIASKLGNTYGRPKNSNDFNWPCLELSKLASYPADLLFRIDMTPQPVAGAGHKPPGFNRGNTNGFKCKHTEEEDY